MNDDIELRKAAIELSARFALIGEDHAISVARADLIYDFIAGLPRRETLRQPGVRSTPS